MTSSGKLDGIEHRRAMTAYASYQRDAGYRESADPLYDVIQSILDEEEAIGQNVLSRLYHKLSMLIRGQRFYIGMFLRGYHGLNVHAKKPLRQWIVRSGTRATLSTQSVCRYFLEHYMHSDVIIALAYNSTVTM